MPGITEKRKRKVRKDKGVKRDFSGMLQKKRPGPPDKHGAFSKHIRERYSDLRTVEGQRLNAVMQGLVADCGGAENVSTAQNVIFETIKSKLIVLFQISKFVDGQKEIIDKDGKLLPCLGRNFISYSEALRRDLESLQKFSNGSKPLSLEDYIDTKYGKPK